MGNSDSIPTDLPAKDHTTLTTKRTSFANDMVKLLSGTASAQVVAFLATPIIARLFAPEAFGIAAGLTSIVTIIIVFLCLRYDQAIVLPDDDKDAAALLGASTLIGIAITSLTAVGLWLWGDQALALVGMQELIPFKWLIVPIVLTNAFYSPLTYWNTRVRRFGLISGGLMINSVGTSGLRIGAGLAGYATSGAMVVADFLGTFLSTLFTAWRTLRASGAFLRESINSKSMVANVQRYLDQPRYGTGAILLNTISWQLPVFVLTAFFSPAVAGQYALGQRIIRVPMSIFGGSISRVFLARAATARFDGTLSSLTRGIFRQLVLFGIAPTLFLLFEGSNLFTLLFGEQWIEAGMYVQILALWSFVWFISSPLSQLQAVLEKQRFFLIWTTLNLVSRFASLWIGAVRGDIYLALSLFGISGTILYGYLVFYLMSCAGIPATRTLRDLALPAVTYLPAVFIILASKRLGLAPWQEIVIATTVLCLTFAISIRNESVMKKAIARFA